MSINTNTMTRTITENRANGKVVRTAEHISSTKVAVTYTDGSKVDMSTDVFKTMHKVVER